MKKYVYVIIIVLHCISCEDYLNKSPMDKPDNTTFLSNEEELIMGINGCYSKLWIIIDGDCPFNILLEAVSDIGTNRLSGNTLHQLSNGSITSDNAWILSRWKDFYSGISACNYLLENMIRSKDKTDPIIYK